MQINLVELNLETLKQLHGGSIFEQVQRLIRAAVTDCETRPTEKRSRKVSLQLEITPRTRTEQVDEDTTRQVLDGLALSLSMDVKCPTRKSIEFDCGVGDNHALLFNPDSPHNHRQTPLPMTFEGPRAVVPMQA